MAVTVTGKAQLSVVVDVNSLGGGGGETLEFSVTATDGKPAHFVLAGATPPNLVLSSKMPPTAASTWSRRWPLAHDPVTLQNEHTLALQFLEARKYNYKVTLHHADGSATPVLNLNFSATSAADAKTHSLLILAH